MSVIIKNDDGCVLGTKILNENGEDVCKSLCVESLSINFESVNAVVTASVHLGLVKTEIRAGNVEWLTKNPVSNKYETVSLIRFASGSVVKFGDDGAIAHFPSGDVVSIDPISDGRIMKFRAAPSEEIDNKE